MPFLNGELLGRLLAGQRVLSIARAPEEPKVKAVNRAASAHLQLAEQAVRRRIQLRNHVFKRRLLRLGQRKLR